MKILMTADTIGGVWTYALELARALRPRGAEIVLATMGAPMNAAQRADASVLRNVRVYESSYRLEWMDDPWSDVARAGEWLLDLEDRERPDVIHLNGYAHGALPWIAPVLVVGHSCVRSWWEAVRGTAIPAEWSTYTERTRAGLLAAQIVVAPSHAMLAALVRHYGPLQHAAVIYNGRRERPFQPAAKEQYIFAAGRVWDEAKNLRALDDIAGELPWRVFVAGSNVGPDGIQWSPARARSLGVLGQPLLAWWLSRAGIYAFPALYEPFGLSVLEAALAGCALVLGDIPSLREVWGDAATLVEPNDRAALARALRWMCEDSTLRSAQAARARRRALHFDLDTMADKYLAVYSGLRAMPRPAAHAPQEVACAS
jgi:glycosyltransferase involved in cell wall biosynthesis